jgi:hypothetical protein
MKWGERGKGAREYQERDERKSEAVSFEGQLGE